MPDNNESQVVPAQTLPLARAEGALLALAAGDALGWPQEMPRSSRGNPASKGPHVEFEGWTRRSGGRFRPFEESIRPGEYSDDTQLTLAVARSRTNHGSAWWKALTKVELPLWTLYERGGGGPRSGLPRRGPMVIHRGGRRRKKESAGTSRPEATE